MARPIAEIHAQILAAIAAEPSLSGLNSESRISVYRALAYAFAVAAWTVEKLFDLHVFQVAADLDNRKAHTARWYAAKALAFQLGHQLVAEQDYYDNTALSAGEVATAQIVKHASIEEAFKGLRIKLATEDGGDLAPLSVAQLAALKAYLEEIKDAGVHLYLESLPADSLKLNLRIYYDPLILDSTGARLDGTAPDPVGAAVRAFLKGNPFDTLFVLAKLMDVLQAVPGVVIPHVVLAQTTTGLLPYSTVDVFTQPVAGYLRILDPADLTITYLAHAPI